MSDDHAETIDDVVSDALTWLDTLTQRDADVFVDELIDKIIALLRRDPRMPVRTYEEWLLLFADVAGRARDDLGALVGGKGDIDDAADAIADALVGIAQKKKRNSAEQAGASQ
jgi:hypothetical protein